MLAYVCLHLEYSVGGMAFAVRTALRGAVALLTRSFTHDVAKI